MNILYLLSQQPDSTGSGFYTRAMIEKAAGAGHRCFLVAAGSGINPPDVRGIGAEFIDLVHFDEEPLSFSIPGMSDVMPYPSSRFMDLTRDQLRRYERVFEEAILNAVHKTRPDIIHSNHLWIMSAIARRLCPDIPMVVSCHGTDLRQFRNCPTLRDNLLRDLPRLDAVFALSLSQKKEIAELYRVDERKIHVVSNGFDPDIFYPAARTPAPPIILLYAGKLSRSKGVHQLLESLDHESIRHRPIHLYLAGSGSGPDKDRCHELALSMVDRVTFCGSLSSRDLGDMMRKAHIFVLPSYYEGLPLVIVEALASGCRVVATDLPGIRELVSGIPGDWGRLVSLPPLETTDSPYERDLPRIREALALALEHQMDECTGKKNPVPDFFKDIRARFSWDHVFHQVETVYGRLL
jgi:glycosyltransferase involved in cell wall biosynthesis